MRELLTFVLGLVSAYLAARWKAHKDLEADYDRDLRAARIAGYRELWKLLEPLARYAPPAPLTTAVAVALANDLRHWYFQTGGLFLSDDSRDAYFVLQEALGLTIAPPADGRLVDAGALPPELAAPLLKAGSALRTATAHDVGTRRTSAVLPA